MKAPSQKPIGSKAASNRRRWVPEWTQRYQLDTFQDDLLAGMTTAIMLIPQSMAYAMLAGIPPIMGLYASTVPIFIYAILGSSRQLAIGPVAMASLLVATGLNEIYGIKEASTIEHIQMVLLLTFTVGVVQVLMGLFRLGGLVNLLSHPVVSGFTAAAAIIIGTSQLQHIVGFPIPKGPFYEMILYALVHVLDVNPSTFGISVIGIAIIVGLKKLNPKLPAALIAVTFGISVAYLFNLEKQGVALLGTIPSGLPQIESLDFIDIQTMERILPISIVIALIAFMESISAAKIYARQNRYNISPIRELVGQGVANMGSSLFGGYVVGGALSRTAVNASAGARTPIAGIITGIVICLTLAFLTAPFAFLPKPILAAIIMVAVVGLIDIKEIFHLWAMKKDDLALLCLTFFATIFLSIELGILIGVMASLLWLVWCSTRPHIAILGKIPNTTSYRSVSHFPQAIDFKQILILRMDAQFFFGNVVYLKETLATEIAKRPDLVAVVLDASSMNTLDSTAADTFEEIINSLRRQHIEVMVSHIKGPVLEVMQVAGIVEILGEGHIHYEVHDAVQAAIRLRDALRSGLTDEQAEEKLGKSDILD